MVMIVVYRSMLCTVSAPKISIPFPKSPCFRRKLAPTRLRVSASLPGSDGAKVEYTPWLVVGLGNPGNKYHGTRHNVGFEMIDRISQEAGIPMNTIQSKALIGIGAPSPSLSLVFLFSMIVLQTGFKWLLRLVSLFSCWKSAQVGPLAAYYQVPLRHILLVYDEMSLPNGVLRVQPKGGHGYHNGYCFTIVLATRQVDAALEQGYDAVRNLVINGFDSRITRFNLGQKYKYHKV
ncbi:hypothetical protein RJ640_011017 [Escallonia rubra]|uniref:Chloroplastic group IIB intron splicing facilitator CRS2, chloroplastic n=1 Tax=Escallonia rubra TaxID=112253 RepID=A0AA88UT51_9ASTE|nr:hypothetical protein RJ640_011017 [Escallonia rubra]